MSEITIDARFARFLVDGLARQNVDASPLLLANGISSISLNKPSQRIKLDQFAAFAVDAMNEIDDEYLGLGVAKQPLGSFAMACRACISARDLEHALKRYANFWNLFNNSFRHDVITSDQTVTYQLTPLPEMPNINNYLVEASLSTTHRFHCWLGGQFIPLKSVSMRCPKPEYAEQLTPLFYGAQIDFDQGSNSIQFARPIHDMQVVQTPETLDEYLAGKNLSLLYQPKNYRALSEQVRQWLERTIEHGQQQATLVEAALHFEMSQQVMHRRLQLEDQSFKEIKKQTRRDIAINLLSEQQRSIEDIAHRIGFSEPSAFIRAFKSWTGLTPLNYRRRKH